MKSTLKATGVACGAAKKMALASEGESGDAQTSKSFRCVSRALAPCGVRPYVCTKIKQPRQGARPKVTFVTLGNG